MLPLILVLIKQEYLYTDLVTIIDSLIPNGNPIYNIFNDIFGTSGMAFVTDNVIKYVTYFISVTFIHLIADIILYIFRVCHNLLQRSLEK